MPKGGAVMGKYYEKYNHTDICGVRHTTFRDPETGEEFTGDGWTYEESEADARTNLPDGD
jgi:hypothetical protein